MNQEAAAAAPAPAAPTAAADPGGLPIAHVVFYAPCIPGNSGAAIRLAAITGAVLHLVEPLGFDLSEARLRRAGLDYHDLARVVVHPDLDAALGSLGVASGAMVSSSVEDPAAISPPQARTPRVWAFSGAGECSLDQADLALGDILLFGPEPTGLPAEVMHDERVTARVRIPMRPGLRSLNLANAASIATYELWRRAGYVGGV